MINGKVLLVGPAYLFFSKGLSIYKYSKKTEKSTKFAELPATPFARLFSRVHLLSRLLRSQVHHMLEDGVGGYYVIFRKSLARLDCDGEIVGTPLALIGSRPLCVVQYRNLLLYGEYTSNELRGSVGVYSYDGTRNEEVLQVRNVRHIHGIFYDKFDDVLYITTGDYGEEAGIWQLDIDTKSLESILQGSQQERAVQLLFCEEYIYYGTDTPSEQNYIYRVSKKDKRRERLGEASSSVFYGTKIDEKMYFATVAEPSSCNTSKEIELLEVAGGEVTSLFKYPKDMWSMRYFQYGQITFPSNTDNFEGDELWIFLLGVRGSGTSKRLINKI